MANMLNFYFYQNPGSEIASNKSDSTVLSCSEDEGSTDLSQETRLAGSTGTHELCQYNISRGKVSEKGEIHMQCMLILKLTYMVILVAIYLN